MRRLAVVLAIALVAACSHGLEKSATCKHADQKRAATAAPTTTEAPAQKATGERSFQPVYCLDLADPYVLDVSGLTGRRLYVFGTTVPLAHIPVLLPKGLLHAEKIVDALPRPARWATDSGGWAPSVLQRGDGFVLYYTITDKTSGRQCISHAEGKKPEGPYVDRSTVPLVCPSQLGGAIDPSPFVDPDGHAFLYWKSDGNCCHMPTGIYVQPLADDGQSVTAPPTEMVRADQPWEGGVVEAPSMLHAEDRFVLFYSGNAWSSAAYGIGYAICAGPTGPCTKALDRPWIGSSSSAAGPGGAEVFVDDDGKARLVFHAWIDGKVGYADGGHRGLFTTRLDIEDGQPVAEGATAG